jgi:ABC-2 type transport system permease protein
VGLRTHLRYMSHSLMALFVMVVGPVVYSVVGIYLYRAGGHPSEAIRATVGAGLMGIWASVLFDSGIAIHRQRWLGTLELHVIAPKPLLLALFPITLATAVMGAYAMVTAIASSAIFFGVSLAPFAHPTFVPSVLICIAAVALMGVFMASSFILLRNPYALVNALEIPVWLLSGMLVPLSVLPRWLWPVSALLPSRWGAEAVRNSVTGGPVLIPDVAALGVGLAYLALAVYAMKRVERRALMLGTLALA